MNWFLKNLYKFFHFHKWEIIYQEKDKYTDLNLDRYEECSCGLIRKRERDFGYGIDMGYETVKTYWNNNIKKELLVWKLIK